MFNLPAYARTFHRFLVLIIVVLGLMMVITGLGLLFGVGSTRILHRTIAPLFSITLILMMGSGLVMYFPGLFALNKIRLLKKETVAEGTIAFYFSKPFGYQYLAGQHADFTVDGLSHTFSFASAPLEKHLMIAMRMRPSEFKQKLANLKIGEKISISPARGNLILEPGKELVFIAGGIGITPFYSIIKQYPNRQITLIHSNRTPKEAPFLKNLKAINVFTQKEGHLTWRKIKQLAPSDAVFYLAGPPDFVNALKKPGVKTEEFTGY